MRSIFKLEQEWLMRRLILSFGAVLMAIPFLSSAKEFALEFKTMDAQAAMSFPGGNGLYGTLQLNKLPEITKAPPSISKHPLFGHLGSQTAKLLFRLDESKGDGQGYDRLVVDVNRNGDLTDDASAAQIGQSERSEGQRSPEKVLFGPILVPNDKKIGEWSPIYFAQLYLYTRPTAAGLSNRLLLLGQLRLKAGWYLATTVNIDGTARKVGIADGDCSFRLGEVGAPTIYQNGTVTNWFFQGGDCFVLDNDGSGEFSSSIGSPESAPFGPLLYLGAKPYKAALAADCKFLKLEPWTEPLAELAFQPHGEQVNGVQLAWESAPGQWQLLQPGVADGKAKVPPGSYRLYSCTLKATTHSGGSLILSGYKRSPKDTVKVGATGITRFDCGAPLRMEVTAARDTRSSSTVNAGARSLLGQIIGAFARKSMSVQQRIEASVTGAGGETYSSFILLDKKELRPLPKPVFTVRTADGKQVDSGKLEFG